jgi:hypothetical protein
MLHLPKKSLKRKLENGDDSTDTERKKAKNRGYEHGAKKSQKPRIQQLLKEMDELE